MRRNKGKDKTDRLLWVLLILFFIGGYMGCRAVQELNTDRLCYQSVEDHFFSALWRAGQFHLPILVVSFCTAGVYLIPLAVMLRGYFLSCAVSVVWLQQAELSWMICGIPAFFQIPSLLYLACAGMRLSAMLRDQTHSRKNAFRKTEMWKRLVWSAVGILLCAAADCYLVPLMIGDRL